MIGSSMAVSTASRLRLVSRIVRPVRTIASDTGRLLLARGVAAVALTFMALALGGTALALRGVAGQGHEDVVERGAVHGDAVVPAPLGPSSAKTLPGATDRSTPLS